MPPLDGLCAGSPLEIEVKDCPEGADIRWEWLVLPPGLPDPDVFPLGDNFFGTNPLPAGNYLLKGICCVE